MKEKKRVRNKPPRCGCLGGVTHFPFPHGVISEHPRPSSWWSAASRDLNIDLNALFTGDHSISVPKDVSRYNQHMVYMKISDILTPQSRIQETEGRSDRTKEYIPMHTSISLHVHGSDHRCRDLYAPGTDTPPRRQLCGLLLLMLYT